MDTEELMKLCDSLSLTKAEEDIFVLQGDSKVRAEKFTTSCLVGKVLSTQVINREAFKTAIKQIWRTLKKVTVENLGENKFIFHFSSDVDRRSVLANGPGALTNL